MVLILRIPIWHGSRRSPSAFRASTQVPVTRIHPWATGPIQGRPFAVPAESRSLLQRNLVPTATMMRSAITAAALCPASIQAPATLIRLWVTERTPERLSVVLVETRSPL